MHDAKKHLEDFLIEHAPLINFHANKLKKAGFIPPHLDMDEIHMAGVDGLMQALHKYDPETGGGKDFVAYAHSRIKGSMLDHIKKQSGVPKHIASQAKRLHAMSAQPVEMKKPAEMKKPVADDAL